MSLKIFLCYAHEDQPAVERIYKQLRADGFAPWMDKHDLLPGQEWEREIPKKVEETDIVLVCLTARFAQKGYKQKEIVLALNTADLQPEVSIFVIPLRLEACSVPEKLNRWHWCNYFEEDGHNALLKALHHRANQLGIQINPPPPPYFPTNPLFPVTVDDWRYELARCNTTFGKPDGYWCYVRPDTYRIGGWEEDQPDADITLPDFWIAKHPITVQQYRQFIQANGYTKEKWWTPNGWEWKECMAPKREMPHWWQDNELNGDNQPVIGISWYEAVAFVHWLSDMLKTNLTDTCLRLPTEAEWEAAAAYDGQIQRRTYPWGEEEPSPEHAVYTDQEQGREPDRPSPVGERLKGKAACGAHDMAGNVWEWTTSDGLLYPQDSGVVCEDFMEGTWNDENILQIPTRGGSYFVNVDVRCAARPRTDPDRYFSEIGFRLVLAPLHT